MPDPDPRDAETDARRKLPIERYAAVLARLLTGTEGLAVVLERAGLTLDVWKGADAAWTAALLKPTGAVHPTPPADLAGELVLRLFQQRAHIERGKAEPWLEDFLPPWTAPARAGEETVPLGTATPPLPATPFRAPREIAAAAPRLSLVDHAVLCAEIAVKLDTTDGLLARRGLSAAEKAALDEHYRRVVVRDARAQSEWQAAFERRRQECAGTRR